MTLASCWAALVHVLDRGALVVSGQRAIGTDERSARAHRRTLPHIVGCGGLVLGVLVVAPAPAQVALQVQKHRSMVSCQQDVAAALAHNIAGTTVGKCSMWVWSDGQESPPVHYQASTMLPPPPYFLYDMMAPVSYPQNPHTWAEGAYMWSVASNATLPGASDGRNTGLGASCGCTTAGAPAQDSVLTDDPINAATGNLVREDTDWTDASHGWLTIQRTYNANVSGAGGSIGSGWTLMVDSSLSFQTTAYAPYTSTAAHTAADGNSVAFARNVSLTTPTTNPVWTALTPDIQDRLTEQDNANGTPTGYTYWNAARRETETYNASGQLLSVTDAHGQGIVLTYGANGTQSSQIATVTDTWGRQLAFSYAVPTGQTFPQMNVSGVTLPDGRRVSYGYDANYDVASVGAPDGTTLTYTYNESADTGGNNFPGFLTGVVDQTGARLETYTYNATGLATSSSQTVGGAAVNSTQVAYASTATQVNPSTITYPSGLTSTMSLTVVNGVALSTGRSAPCAPECGTTIASTTYNNLGRPQSQTDFNGHTTAFTYDAAGLTATEIEAQGTSGQRTTTTTWNDTLMVPLTRSVANASGVVLTQEAWFYDATGQVLAHCLIDPTVAGAGGYACGSVPSGAGGGVPTGVRQTTYQWCSGQTSGFTPTTQCPIPGLLLSVTGPRTDLTQTTTYTYYATSSSTGCGTPGAACYRAGDLESITDAAGNTTTVASYDADGRPTRTTDANGVNTDITYDATGRVVARTVASGTSAAATTTVTYTAYGAVRTTTDPDGVVTTYGYDQAHRLTLVTDDVGNTMAFALDATGHVTARTITTAGGAVASSRSQTFNTLGQMTTVVDGLNQTVFNASGTGAYDGNGNLLQSTNALGFAQQRSYDPLNRLKQTLDNYNGSDPNTANTSVQYAYDALDRLTSVTDPSGLVTTYGFDGLSNPTSLTSPDTGVTLRTFDAAGNALTVTDANGNVATSTYDALDRKTATVYQNAAQNVAYTYDEGNTVTGCAQSAPVGRLTRIVEGAVATVFCYDARGNVIEKEQTLTPAGGVGVTDTVGYAYTAGDRLSTILYPSGTEATYTRDGDGRVTSVGITPVNGVAVTAVSGVTYEPFGPVLGYTLGNGQTVSRTFDANYRLTDLTSPALTLHFARDALGDITALGSAPGANPALETYSYDPLQRLTTITEAGGSVLESVAYNQTGDRLSKSGMGLATGTYSYNPGTHQLVATGNAARSVDADGNTTAIGSAGTTYGFGYNARNRLAVAQVGGATVGVYLDNALNERVQKTVGSTSTRFDYNESAQLLGEYGVNSRDDVWLDGLPVANVDTTAGASTVSYVTADGLGTPRAVSDATGNLEWQNAYQGNVWNENAPVSVTGYVENRGFPGQYSDAETGLFNNVNRYFEPATGRYGQADPLGYGGGQNSLYLYASGAPLNGVDPLGLQECDGSEIAKEWIKDQTKDEAKDKTREMLEERCNAYFSGTPQSCSNTCQCVHTVDLASCGGPTNGPCVIRSNKRSTVCGAVCGIYGTFTPENEREWTGHDPQF